MLPRAGERVLGSRKEEGGQRVLVILTGSGAVSGSVQWLDLNGKCGQDL